MKTRAEIQAEATWLGVLSQRYWQQRRDASGNPALEPASGILQRLPDSRLTLHYPEPEGVRVHLFERTIQVAPSDTKPMFALVEVERVMGAKGEVIQPAETTQAMTSPSPFGLLQVAYEIIEEERLAEALAPYVEQCEERESASDESIRKIEEITESALLSPGARMRARADAIEFLEGRLEASAFIERTIDRHCEREAVRLSIRDGEFHRLEEP